MKDRALAALDSAVGWLIALGLGTVLIVGAVASGAAEQVADEVLNEPVGESLRQALEDCEFVKVSADRWRAEC